MCVTWHYIHASSSPHTQVISTLCYSHTRERIPSRLLSASTVSALINFCWQSQRKVHFVSEILSTDTCIYTHCTQIHVYTHCTQIHVYTHCTQIHAYTHCTQIHVYTHCTQIHVYTHCTQIHVYTHCTHVHNYTDTNGLWVHSSVDFLLMLTVTAQMCTVYWVFGRWALVYLLCTVPQKYM